VSNVIDVLERLGQDARLSRASEDVLAQALEHSGLEPPAMQAILRGDRRGLEALLGVRANVCCLVYAPDEEPPEGDEPEEPGDGGEQDEPAPQQPGSRRIA
jgi:hypothetical protein